MNTYEQESDEAVGYLVCTCDGPRDMLRLQPVCVTRLSLLCRLLMARKEVRPLLQSMAALHPLPPSVALVDLPRRSV